MASCLSFWWHVKQLLSNTLQGTGLRFSVCLHFDQLHNQIKNNVKWNIPFRHFAQINQGNCWSEAELNFQDLPLVSFTPGNRINYFEHRCYYEGCCNENVTSQNVKGFCDYFMRVTLCEWAKCPFTWLTQMLDSYCPKEELWAPGNRPYFLDCENACQNFYFLQKKDK